jgi:predicted neutral ceramidase superfamily lipid hydrolase
MNPKDKGRITSQIIETARQNIDDLDRVGFGEVTFFIKDGSAYRMQISISKLIKDKNEETH